MTAKKKLVNANIDPNPSFRERIKHAVTTPAHQRTMLKDIPLIEAALENDKVVISLDETARQIFRNVSDKVSDLGKITWVNPEKPQEEPLAWLRQGAQPEMARRLQSSATS